MTEEWQEGARRGPAALLLTPGTYVRNPDRPEWGLGQVQSVVGQRITVNFEHEGKLAIDGARVTLKPE